VDSPFQVRLIKMLGLHSLLIDKFVFRRKKSSTPPYTQPTTSPILEALTPSTSREYDTRHQITTARKWKSSRKKDIAYPLLGSFPLNWNRANGYPASSIPMEIRQILAIRCASSLPSPTNTRLNMWHLTLPAMGSRGWTVSGKK
jgi:hypothetical protein